MGEGAPQRSSAPCSRPSTLVHRPTDIKRTRTHFLGNVNGLTRILVCAFLFSFIFAMLLVTHKK